MSGGEPAARFRCEAGKLRISFRSYYALFQFENVAAQDIERRHDMFVKLNESPEPESLDFLREWNQERRFDCHNRVSKRAPVCNLDFMLSV
jgi:hypothetical protein